jgi:hypothetical protein
MGIDVTVDSRKGKNPSGFHAELKQKEMPE